MPYIICSHSDSKKLQAETLTFTNTLPQFCLKIDAEEGNLRLIYQNFKWIYPNYLTLPLLEIYLLTHKIPSMYVLG